MGELQDMRSSYGASVAPLDPDSGQRGAFPGLDEHTDEDELFYGPASDGLEYLRMVRREALSVPKLLKVHNRPSIQAAESPETVSGGRYEDGAFIAQGLETFDDSLDDDDAQGIYYHNLFQRFARFRNMIAKPPEGMLSRTRGQLPRALQFQVRQAQWSHDLRHSVPTTYSLLPTSQEDVIRGIRRLESLLTMANFANEVERTNLASWTWALLGRCRDLGTLDSEDIGVLRSLAKSALSLSNRLRRSQHHHMEQERLADLHEENIQSDSDERHDNDSRSIVEAEPPMDSPSMVPEELEAARSAMLNRLQEGHIQDDTQKEAESSSERNADDCENALIALDIIITIVGGAFGQKDLLDLRAAWK